MCTSNSCGQAITKRQISQSRKALRLSNFHSHDLEQDSYLLNVKNVHDNVVILPFVFF